MITRTKTITIGSKAKAPYTYSFTLPESCVTKVSDSISNNVITVTFGFEDEACLNRNSTIVMTLQDADGCKNSFNVNITNPCTSFQFTLPQDVQLNGTNIIDAPVEGGVGPYTYEWTVDTNVLNIDSQSGTQIVVSLNDNIFGVTSTEIGLTVTDNSGCEISTTYDYTVCFPTANNLAVAAACIYDEDLIDVGRFPLSVTPCVGLWQGEIQNIPIDWNTTELDVPTGVEWENLIGQFVSIEFPIYTPKGIYEIPYRVTDMNGSVAEAKIVVTIPDCSDNPDFNADVTLIPYSYTFGCSVCENNVTTDFNGISIPDRSNESVVNCIGAISVAIDSLIVSPFDLNYDTFKFIQLPGQILVSPTQIQTENGIAYFSNNQEIVYVPDLIPTSDLPDIVKFTVELDIGVVVTHQITFNRDYCGAAPTAVDDNLCVVCGNSTGQIDLLLNDLGEIDTSTFTFLGPVPSASQGTLNILPNGVIEFIPASMYTGDVDFSYRVKSVDGQWSNNALVSIQVKCLPDVDFEKSYCSINAGAIDLWSLINGTVTDNSLNWYFNGYSVTETGTKTSATFGVNNLAKKLYEIGSLISSPNIAIVDLEDNDDGFYHFQYKSGKGSCAVSVDLIVEIVTAVEVPDDEVVYTCTLNQTVNIGNLVSETLPTGIWSSILSSTVFDPVTGILDVKAVGAGTYMFTFAATNSGTFNNVCSSTFNLTVIIEDEAYNPGTVCYYFCTEGPLPTDPVNCRVDK